MSYLLNEKGQLVVEYVLLLLISVALALVIVQLVNLDSEGVLFNYWSRILKIIAEDIST